eukprot:TRINITY_DN9059_c0_g1_i1.p1 TRINITY_DN9059_c0_g1~~TRINITY_DN9059_c0_g1_i1.p1  ORF type:complete len:693 (+),score=157.20 TRINITY_DN9059_c0_g1_i1:652-2730(+)
MASNDTCSYLIRGKRRCVRETTEGSATCSFHSTEEMARQKALRDERREQIIESGLARRKVDILALVEKMKKVEPDLTPVVGGVCAMKEAGKLFDEMCERQKTMWQKAKRSWHQPQIESLAKHVTLLGILSPHTVLLELGAGKGLLGAIIGKLNMCEVVVLDKREGGTGGCGDDEGNCGVRRIHADLSDTQLHHVTGGKPAVVIAKHFCGDATDLAIKSIENPDASIKAAVVAPCCHPKISFAKYTGGEYLAAHGFDCNDFEAMQVLMEISRERTQHKHQASYAKKLCNLDKVPHAAFYALGRLSRRIIEEGRMHYLRKSWRSVRLVEYVPHAVSPDNLFLLAENTEPKPLPTSTMWTQYSSTGVILHLTSRVLSDLPMRTSEYLLEKRDKGSLPIDMVWIADMRLDRAVADACSTEVVVLHTSSPVELLCALRGDSLLERVIDKIFPFTHVSESLEAAVHKEVAADKLNRVYAYPKALEGEVVSLLGDAAPLHTTKFEVVVSVFEWSLEAGSPPVYLSSSVDVSVWNPRDWPSLGSTAPVPRAQARMQELIERNKIAICSTFTLVTSEGTDHAYLATYLSASGAERVNIAHARVAATGVTFTPSVLPARYILVLLDSTKEDILQAIAALPRDPCTVVAPLKICPPAKRNNPAAVKSAHAKIASELHNVAQSLEVLHLLCDKDNERTITCDIK